MREEVNSEKKIPQHIAVVMDGNGRWAKKRLLPRMAGHKAGLDAVRTIIKCSVEHQVKVLTLFAFSSENWSRPASEVSGLMQLFIQALKAELKKLHENQIQLRFIGDLSRLSQELRSALQEAVELTQHNSGLVLVIALDYGGRWDILQAVKKMCHQVQSNNKSIEQISAEDFQACLSTGDLPEPDLFIRTSGEMRISNFLLWQLAYTELYFSPTYWPDFNESIFQDALAFYASRERRFGGLKREKAETSSPVLASQSESSSPQESSP